MFSRNVPVNLIMQYSLPFLIDFDGVLKIKNSPAPDVKYFLSFLSQNKIHACIISNSTLRTGDLVKEFFNSHNIELAIPAITAFDSTASYVKKNYKKVAVYCSDNLMHHFKEIIDFNNPEAVVIGDIGDRWNYNIMNEIFRFVCNGADFIAMHKNKFWKPESQLVLDTGAFVSAIEFAAGREATVIGKPSSLYFKSALEIISANPDDVFIMIGDDIENDIEAAQKAGGKGVLIYTGKTTYPHNHQKIKPDYEVNTLTEVTKLNLV